eukprot:3154995-Rhodomonas_salina.3
MTWPVRPEGHMQYSALGTDDAACMCGLGSRARGLALRPRRVGDPSPGRKRGVELRDRESRRRVCVASARDVGRRAGARDPGWRRPLCRLAPAGCWERVVGQRAAAGDGGVDASLPALAPCIAPDR